VVAHRRAAAAALERVADGAAPAGIGGIDPNLEPALLDVAIQIEVADAGLDDGVVRLVVDLDDAVHALQVDDDAARVGGRRAAVAQVLPR
jgi:hypothetical protein